MSHPDAATVANSVTLTWPSSVFTSSFEDVRSCQCACVHAPHSSEQRPKLKWGSFKRDLPLSSARDSHRHASLSGLHWRRVFNGNTLHVDLQSTFLTRIKISVIYNLLGSAFTLRNIVLSLQCFLYCLRHGIKEIEEKLGFLNRDVLDGMMER